MPYFVRKRTVCNDGISLSIQAGQYAYCTPREDDSSYSTVEVGFIGDANGLPVTPPSEWEPYGDGEFPSDVYGYVPVDVVERFIAEHGGRKNFV